LLVLGPGHQAAVVEAMQQVIDRLTAQGHAEFRPGSKVGVSG
jgi:hypothetical protein